jgi:SAM-dependent methyltransferase
VVALSPRVEIESNALTQDRESIQARITEFWSATASEYNQHPGNIVALGSPEHEVWVEAIQEALPPPPSDILDIGTGTGFVAFVASTLGHRVTGIDLSDAMLAVARAEAQRRGLEVHFLTCDAVVPELPTATFDAIACRNLLWTLREPETAFGNWRRLLRPGGRVVAFDAFWSSPSEPDEDQKEEDAEVGFFERYYTKETLAALPLRSARLELLIDMFERAGFADITVAQMPLLRDATAELDGREPYRLVARRA